MADKVLNVGVRFNVKPVDGDASRPRNAGEVVTHQINEHSVLCPFLLIDDHRLSKGLTFLHRCTLRAGAFDRRRLNGGSVARQQGFGRRTRQGEPKVFSFHIGREGGWIDANQPVKHGEWMVDFPLPVLPDVDLIHLPVDDALANRLDVVLMGFVGVGDRFTGLEGLVGWGHGRVVSQCQPGSVTPCLIVAEHGDVSRSRLNRHAAGHVPQHGQQRTFFGRVLKANRLRPLHQVVRQSTRPERAWWKAGVVRFGKGFGGCFVREFVKQVLEVAGAQGHAVVPRAVFPFLDFSLEERGLFDQTNIAADGRVRWSFAKQVA